MSSAPATSGHWLNNLSERYDVDEKANKTEEEKTHRAEYRLQGGRKKRTTVSFFSRHRPACRIQLSVTVTESPESSATARHHTLRTGGKPTVSLQTSAKKSVKRKKRLTHASPTVRPDCDTGARSSDIRSSLIVDVCNAATKKTFSLPWDPKPSVPASSSVTQCAVGAACISRRGISKASRAYRSKALKAVAIHTITS